MKSISWMWGGIKGASVAGFALLFLSGARAGTCPATKEFVTALEYLRDQKELALPEKESQNLADQISKGCDGAARRFVQVTALLSKAGFSSRDAVQTGIQFAHAEDAAAEAFVTVFQQAYLSEYLDLDARSALHLAQSLSTEFKGSRQQARQDFLAISKFCVTTEGLDLPKPRCAQMAARVARYGQDSTQGVAGEFVGVYEFVRASGGAGRTTAEALQIAEQVVAQGAGAGTNFIQAYRYASAQRGLGLGGQDALGFAKKMASRNESPQPDRAVASKSQ